MIKPKYGLLSFAILCANCVAVSASPPVIGVARSPGAFLIDNASVPGTATILDGTSLKTAGDPSDVNLKNGERLVLASSSAATVHLDRLILDRGATELSGPSAYRIETGNLRIAPTGSGAHIRVALEGANSVQVAALTGGAEVRNMQGLLVAKVLSGTALQLKAADPSTVELTGVVVSAGGKFFLTDETNHVKVELRASNLKEMAGKHVHITGTVLSGETPADGAAEVVQLSESKKPAGAVGGPAVGAAVAAHGLSTTTICIIGGIAATAGTLVGLRAADVIGGGSSQVSR